MKLSFSVPRNPSERAAEGEGELGVLAAEGIVVGLGGLTVVNAEASMGFQTCAWEDKGIFHTGAEQVLRSNEILILAIEEGLHGVISDK